MSAGDVLLAMFPLIVALACCAGMWFGDWLYRRNYEAKRKAK
jgi:hypothetical protein